MARVVARVVVGTVAGVGASTVARVGVSSLFGLLPLSLGDVVVIHHPEVGQHLLEEKEG